MNYRHEQKYKINRAQAVVLKSRLNVLMRHDSNAILGTYTIRSIYFDNENDTALREKIDGVPKRTKWRIRWYNDNLSYIVLEKKSKIYNLCAKQECQLSQEEVQRILAQDVTWIIDDDRALLQEFYVYYRNQRIRPRVIVSYEREPFVYDAGNVRVTFDDQIRTSLFQKITTLSVLSDIDAMDETIEVILEIKYDGFLPDIIREAVQMESARETAYSKYGMCRKFG